MIWKEDGLFGDRAAQCCLYNDLFQTISYTDGDLESVMIMRAYNITGINSLLNRLVMKLEDYDFKIKHKLWRCQIVSADIQWNSGLNKQKSRKNSISIPSKQWRNCSWKTSTYFRSDMLYWPNISKHNTFTRFKVVYNARQYFVIQAVFAWWDQVTVSHTKFTNSWHTISIPRFTDDRWTLWNIKRPCLKYIASIIGLLWKQISLNM